MANNCSLVQQKKLLVANGPSISQVKKTSKLNVLAMIAMPMELLGNSVFNSVNSYEFKVRPTGVW